MKILFWCGDYLPSPGGAQSLVHDLADALRGREHQATVLARSLPGSPEFERTPSHDIVRFDFPVRYERLQLTRVLVERTAAVSCRVHSFLAEGRFDVVCIGLLDMSALYLLTLRSMFPFRLVLYLHGGETRKLSQAQPTFKDLLSVALGMADAIVAVSDDLAREATGVRPDCASKIRVIPNGIDLRTVKTAQARPHPREYLCFAGRLVEEKSAATLLKAFRAAQEQIGDVDLIVAGGGPLETELRALARDCPRPEAVHFLGTVDRNCVHALLKGALFVVLPSITEGFSIVSIEALAMGTPVIGSRIPGIASVAGDGVSGALYTPADEAELAGLIRRYCLDRQALASLAAGARATDLSRFDIAALAGEHLRAYGGPDA